MPPLVAGYTDGLGVLFNGCKDDLFGTAIMPEVNDFNTGVLEHSAHDIDRSVMAIEKGCGGDHADGVSGLAGLGSGPHRCPLSCEVKCAASWLLDAWKPAQLNSFLLNFY